MPIIPKDQLRKLIKQYNLKDTNDIQGMLKDMFGDAIQDLFKPPGLSSSMIWYSGWPSSFLSLPLVVLL